MMTRKEKTQQMLEKCFNAKEWTFLLMDKAFKTLANSAETLDDLEQVAKRGAIILTEAEFARNPKDRSGPQNAN